MTATPRPPIALRDMGSFHIGGRRVDIGGKPLRQVNLTQNGMPITIDPNGTYHVEQMYVQYFLPAEETGAYPLLLWHGGGLTGVTYETTPDGREGWLNYFLRQGWSVYISDAVERGRSGWAPYPDVFKDEPIFLPAHDPFVRFRIGDGPGSYHADPAQRRLKPGNQFPNAGYDNFVMQGVPRWPGNDDATIAAYIAEVDRVGPCVLLVHSQSGPFGFKVAQARPDKVKALIAVEPVGGGDPAQGAVLKDIPVLMIYGDFIDTDPRWPTIRATGMAFADKIRAAGGSVDVVDLPKAGITGNSHMIMMDSNNAEVAALIQTWLESKGLTRSSAHNAGRKA